MTSPIEQILNFTDAHFVDKFLRSAMTDPYSEAVESSGAFENGTNYILCYVQRSGSTHLASLLQNTGLAGKPADFLNPAYSGLPVENQQVAQRTGAVTIVDAVREYGVRSVSEYVLKLRKLTHTPNGVFGLKVDLAHASCLLRSGIFFDRGWDWKYIYLTRQDLLKQAISYYVAMQTGLWSSLSVGDRSAIFDERLITQYMLMLSDFMHRWECIFHLFNIEPLRVYYEQIETDARSTVQQCLQALEMPSNLTDLPINSLYRKQRTDDTEQWSAAMIRSAREYHSHGTTLREDGGCATSSMSGERIVWARKLTDRHVGNCRIFPSREELISTMGKNAVCAEVGVESGYFSAQILKRTAPRKLHLLDLAISQIRYDRYPELLPAIESGVVQLHQGRSVDIFSTFPESYFDWIYIDGDHSFAGVTMDITQAIRVIKPQGLIVFNDYVKYSALELVQYGVMEAVNDLCVTHDFEMVGLALHGLGYFDVVLRKIREGAEPAKVSTRQSQGQRVPDKRVDRTG